MANAHAADFGTWHLRPASPFLTETYGSNDVRMFAKMTQDNCAALRVGRARPAGMAAHEMALEIASPLVSATHAVIAIRGDKVTLEDCSRNGTFVNGSRVEKSVVLNVGDNVWFGAQNAPDDKLVKYTVVEVARPTATAQTPVSPNPDHKKAGGVDSPGSPVLEQVNNMRRLTRHNEALRDQIVKLTSQLADAKEDSRRLSTQLARAAEDKAAELKAQEARLVQDLNKKLAEAEAAAHAERRGLEARHEAELAAREEASRRALEQATREQAKRVKANEEVQLLRCSVGGVAKLRDSAEDMMGSLKVLLGQIGELTANAAADGGSPRSSGDGALRPQNEEEENVVGTQVLAAGGTQVLAAPSSMPHPPSGTQRATQEPEADAVAAPAPTVTDDMPLPDAPPAGDEIAMDGAHAEQDKPSTPMLDIAPPEKDGNVNAERQQEDAAPPTSVRHGEAECGDAAAKEATEEEAECGDAAAKEATEEEAECGDAAAKEATEEEAECGDAAAKEVMEEAAECGDAAAKEVMEEAEGGEGAGGQLPTEPCADGAMVEDDESQPVVRPAQGEKRLRSGVVCDTDDDEELNGRSAATRRRRRSTGGMHQAVMPPMVAKDNGRVAWTQEPCSLSLGAAH